MDSSDPYIVLKNMNGDVVYKTEFVPKNLNPKWETFEVSLEKLCGNASLSDAEFIIECWDYDALSNDDIIGKAIVSLKDIVTGREIQLENSAYDSSNPPPGSNMLRIRRAVRPKNVDFGKSAEALMEDLERELLEEKECRASLEDRIKQMMERGIEHQELQRHKEKMSEMQNVLEKQGVADLRSKRSEIALKESDFQSRAAWLSYIFAKEKEADLEEIISSPKSTPSSPSPYPITLPTSPSAPTKVLSSFVLRYTQISLRISHPFRSFVDRLLNIFGCLPQIGCCSYAFGISYLTEKYPANPKHRLIEYKLNPQALIEYATGFNSSSIALNLPYTSLSHHTHLIFLT
jgi:hypothetical protein